MPSDNEYVEARCFLHVRPEWSPSGLNILGAKVIKLTINRPDKPAPGSIPVETILKLPKSLFIPPVVSTVVQVPREDFGDFCRGRSLRDQCVRHT